MPRPKLDPAITQRLVDLVRAGNTLDTAATACGIHRTTLHRWLRHGKGQQRGRYHKLFEGVEKAQAEAEARDVAIIAKAATEDWRAAAWRLERRLPRKYAPRVQLAVQEELESVLTRLENGLESEVFDRVLQLISAEDEPEAVQPAKTLERLPP
jgi:predicted site-specific integrase-resolvase